MHPRFAITSNWPDSEFGAEIETEHRSSAADRDLRELLPIQNLSGAIHAPPCARPTFLPTSNPHGPVRFVEPKEPIADRLDVTTGEVGSNTLRCIRSVHRLADNEVRLAELER